jgi:hypothetical protein
MKKVVVLISTVILFAGLTFGQTQTQDKSKSAPAKTETKKDSKAKCDPKSCKDAGKSGCCKDGDKKGEGKSEKTAPEKK